MNEDTPDLVADRVKQAIREPVQISSNSSNNDSVAPITVKISASIGVATNSPHETTSSAMLESADAAMELA